MFEVIVFLLNVYVHYVYDQHADPTSSLVS